MKTYTSLTVLLIAPIIAFIGAFMFAPHELLNFVMEVAK